jgi:hypothetical protein
MKRNIVHIIYPCEKVISFIHESDDTVDSILESAFAMFNHGSGSESELFLKSNYRSLSVNDIVAVNALYFQCLSFGWKEVTAEFVNDLEDEVENNPNMIHSPWHALQDVMWNRQDSVMETV